MRVTLLSVAFLTCLVTLAGTSSGQNTREKVTVRFSDMPLKKVLRELERTTKLNFTWRSNDVANSPNITYTATNEFLFRVLGNVLEPAGLSFVQRGNNIVLVRRPATPFLPVATEVDNKLVTILYPLYDTVPVYTVKGRITSSEKLNEPVPNATVTVKGRRISTMTDPDGYFTIKIPKGAILLTFTQVGYEPVEARIDFDGQMFISMKPRAQAMTEVITTGIYKRPKESFTGAATTITGDQIRAMSMTNALSAIKIFDPSIRIPDNIQFGSDPNQLPNISIRGTNNFSQSLGSNSSVPQSGADFMASYSSNPNQPIFILDGFEVSLQKIYDLDINRIASYTILKDAAATSMYGSRASNGVIIVDTKQPAPGKLQASYSGSLNITGPDLSVYNLLNAKEKLEVEKIAGIYTTYEGQTGSGAYLDAYWRRLLSYRESLVAKGVNTDWMSLPLRNGVGSNHSLNLGGGDQYMRYQLNVNYKSDAGVMKGSSRDVYSGDMTLSYRYRGLNFRNAMSLGFGKANNSPYGNFSDYSKQNPYWAPYDDAGNPVKVLEQFEEGTAYTNPLFNSTLNVIDKNEYNNINNNTEIEWNVGNGFRITGSVGISKQTEEYDEFLPAQHTSFVTENNPLRRGSYTKSYTKFFNLQTRLKFDYSKRIGRGQIFNTALTEINQSTRNGISYTVIGFPHERLDDILFGNGYPENTKPIGYKDISRRVSFGENFSFTWDQRYAVEGSLRFDGASQFGSNNRFAAFWSLGGSWNLHKEEFFTGLPQINQFRVRGSIGTTGDDRFNTNQAITTYNYFTNTSFHGVPGTNLSTYGNPDLSWQQAVKKNIGMDLTMFNERLQVNGDFYVTNTDRLLLDVNTPPSVGVTSYKENIGSLQNIGYEFSVKYNIIHKTKESFYWTIFLNGNSNKSKILSISNSLKKLNELNDRNPTSGSEQFKQVRPQNKYVEGYSPDAIWGVRSLGIDPSTGREMFLTADNKLTYVWDARDKVIIGDPSGGLFGNFGSSVSFKNITFNIACSFQTDVQIYNQTLADRVENLNLTWQADKRVLNERWKNPGDITKYKGLRDENGYTVTTKTYVTSRFLQKNNFINLSSISASYQLPDNISKKAKLKTTRLSLIANNITRWSSIEMERGLDYPFARVFTFNLVTNF
ncbi:SusC/RagA family TonB-linked outer membrane protein [Pseudobacter ginsenosidimutans]|nr:SusC/RagA family TonB-linked outer membrane protein [Pseudobacter ginsenosidimutans]